MNQIENNAFFWQKLDTIYNSSDFKLSNPKGTSHEKYHNLIYPVDYGYLEDMDNNDSQIRVYKGTQKGSSIKVAIISADILNKDITVKLLIGCSEQEEKDILSFLNQTDFQKTVLIRRSNDIPSWGMSN